MTEPTQPNPDFPRDEPSPQEIANEMRELGKNLVAALRSAWESDERKKLQQEINDSLNDLGKTLNEAATEFKQSPTGQRLQEDVQDLKQRVRNGEVESKVRQDILSALRTVNAELEKASHKKDSEL